MEWLKKIKLKFIRITGIRVQTRSRHIPNTNLDVTVWAILPEEDQSTSTILHGVISQTVVTSTVSCCQPQASVKLSTLHKSYRLFVLNANKGLRPSETPHGSTYILDHLFPDGLPRWRQYQQPHMWSNPPEWNTAHLKYYTRTIHVLHSASISIANMMASPLLSHAANKSRSNMSR
jgi:hypothetical protein